MKTKIVALFLIVIVILGLYLLIKDVNFTDEDIINNKYILVFHGHHLTELRNLNYALIIQPSIKEIVYDEQFILVAQIWNPKWWHYDIDISIYEYSHPKKMNFWIINTKSDNIYGPYNLNEYLEKRIEMKIPNNLKLELKL